MQKVNNNVELITGMCGIGLGCLGTEWGALRVAEPHPNPKDKHTHTRRTHSNMQEEIMWWWWSSKEDPNHWLFIEISFVRYRSDKNPRRFERLRCVRLNNLLRLCGLWGVVSGER